MLIDSFVNQIGELESRLDTANKKVDYLQGKNKGADANCDTSSTETEDDKSMSLADRMTRMEKNMALMQQALGNPQLGTADASAMQTRLRASQSAYAQLSRQNQTYSTLCGIAGPYANRVSYNNGRLRVPCCPSAPAPVTDRLTKVFHVKMAAFNLGEGECSLKKDGKGFSFEATGSAAQKILDMGSPFAKEVFGNLETVLQDPPEEDVPEEEKMEPDASKTVDVPDVDYSLEYPEI